MCDELHEKSVKLLNLLSNSVYERDTKNPILLCFTSNEVNLVKDYLAEMMKESHNWKP